MTEEGKMIGPMRTNRLKAETIQDFNLEEQAKTKHECGQSE